MLLFETLLPVRFYLPREDVVVRLEPSDTVTYCAYKGRASYFSVPDGPRDVAWTYHEPLHDAEQVRDRICFFDERLDVTVDGERRPGRSRRGPTDGCFAHPVAGDVPCRRLTLPIPLVSTLRDLATLPPSKKIPPRLTRWGR